jgi:transposase
MVERQEREMARYNVRIQELEQMLVAKDKRIAELEEELAKARKNSQNSSKPPSSDITKPPTAQKHNGGDQKKRNIGGQEGHPKHESNLTLADADRVVNLHVDRVIHDTARDLVPAPDLQPKIIFQYELAAQPVELTAYVSHPYRDRKTGEIFFPPFPTGVEAAGILGPRLTALAAGMKGGIHASYSGIEKVFSFLGVNVSRSTLCNKILKASEALAFAHGELLEALPKQDQLNVDETGHKDHPFEKSGQQGKHWIWVFAAATFTVFKIFASRGTDVLREVLGENCEAILGSDFYSAYRRFMKEAHIKVQFCWAHLIRELRFLSESTDKVTANYGRRMLKICKLIFHLQHHRKELGEEKFRRKMMRLKDKFLATGCRTTAPGARNMVKRLKRYGEDYFLFLENPRIEPTNNLAEREGRHCVIDRKITQGTRGIAGKQWCERIWTVLATCARQQRDPYAFILDSLNSFYAGQRQPSLLSAD